MEDNQIPIPPGSFAVATLTELIDAKRLVREANGTSVLLLMTGAGVVAVQNTCTHLNMPLDQGRMIAGNIYCPHHGACFDLATGRAISGPAVTPLKRYAVTINGGEIYLSPP